MNKEETKERGKVERIAIDYIYIEKEVNPENGELWFMDLIAVGKNGKNYKAVGLYCGGIPVIGWRENF